MLIFFFFQAEDGIRDYKVTGVQTCALPIYPRQAKAFIPDIWLRLNWKKLHIEAEGAMVVGVIGNLTDIDHTTAAQSTSILSGGFTVKADYKLLHDALKLYFEVGFASGDDVDDPVSQLNYRQQTYIPV